jgi:hypothetical protein
MAAKRKRASRLEEAKQVVSALSLRERQELLGWMKAQGWTGHNTEILIERVREILEGMFMMGDFHENPKWKRDDDIIRLKDVEKQTFKTIASRLGIDGPQAAKQAYHRRQAHLTWLEDHLDRLEASLRETVLQSDP